jgi:hypothetical protein
MPEKMMFFAALVLLKMNNFINYGGLKHPGWVVGAITLGYHDSLK